MHLCFIVFVKKKDRGCVESMEIPTELGGVSTIFAVSIQTGFKFKLKKSANLSQLCIQIKMMKTNVESVIPADFLLDNLYLTFF